MTGLESESHRNAKPKDPKKAMEKAVESIVRNTKKDFRRRIQAVLDHPDAMRGDKAFCTRMLDRLERVNLVVPKNIRSLEKIEAELREEKGVRRKDSNKTEWTVRREEKAKSLYRSAGSAKDFR